MIAVAKTSPMANFRLLLHSRCVTGKARQMSAHLLVRFYSDSVREIFVLVVGSLTC